MTSGGGSGGGATTASRASASTSARRVERRRVDGRAPARPDAARPRPRDGTARPVERASASRRPASRWARYRRRRARSSASGSGPSSPAASIHRGRRRPRQHRPALDEDELRGDRDERADVAEPVGLERRQRLEIGVGEAAERDGQDVELARLDEREQQPERAVELGDRTCVAVSGRRPSPNGPPATGPSPARRRGGPIRTPGDRRHQFASSASWSSAPATGSTGASWWRISSTVRGEQPAAAASAPTSRRGRAAGRAPAASRARRRRRRQTHAPYAWPSEYATRGQTPCRPCPRRGAGRPAGRRVGHAVGAERRDDVEAVTPVGDVHRVEQRQLGGRQPARQRRALRGPRPGPEVRAELADLRAPPGAIESASRIGTDDPPADRVAGGKKTAAAGRTRTARGPAASARRPVAAGTRTAPSSRRAAGSGSG